MRHQTTTPSTSFWRGRRVFVTGHTGFKGSWLCLWLHRLGAEVHGYALEPPTTPNLFTLANIEPLLAASHQADIRDFDRLATAVRACDPEVVIHMAAQPLVRESYRIPLETYAVNVMGTAHLLEALRQVAATKAVVNVTTDKCYENREWLWGYREDEALGGYDPYSSSKACAELVTTAYRRSFYAHDGGAAIATARAGNVIGGGDWAVDRLVPDLVRALLAQSPVTIRNPHAIRPWQHVLEPLCGYLLLAQHLVEDGASFAQAWNFGPLDDDVRTVEEIVRHLCARWSDTASFVIDGREHPHEAHYLKLDSSKSRTLLGWQPRWRLAQALDAIVDWTRAYQSGSDLRSVTLDQIASFETGENS